MRSACRENTTQRREVPVINLKAIQLFEFSRVKKTKKGLEDVENSESRGACFAATK